MKKGRGTPSRLLTDALREIARTRSRFLSIVVLSALAVCFLAGLRATAPDMKLSADRYFDQQRLMDLRVVSTLGLTQEDVKALGEQKGILLAEGAYTVDGAIRVENNDLIVKAHSLSENINLPKLKEGRMPQRADECLVEPRLLQESGLKIGDTITLDTGTGDFQDALTGADYTIVGTADSPLYIGVERGSSSLGTGKVSAYVLLPRQAFSMDYYTDAYLLTQDSLELETYSDAYEALAEENTLRLENLGEERAPMRRQEILDEANGQLADAQAELDEATAQAESELSDASRKLADARRELDSGWDEYYDGLDQYQKGLWELNDQVTQAQQKIQDGERELSDAKAQLSDARGELDSGWKDYYDGHAEYTKGLRDYETGLKEYEDGKKKYEDGKQEYESGLRKYERGRDQLSAGLQKLNQQEEVYAAGKEQFSTLLDTILTAAGLPMTQEELIAALKAEAALPPEQGGDGQPDIPPAEGEDPAPETEGQGDAPQGEEQAPAALRARTGEGQEGGAQVSGAVDQVLSGMVGQLQQKKEELSGKIAALEAQLAGAQQETENLAAKMEEIKAAISAGQAAGEDTSALEAQLAALEGELAQLQESILKLEEGIAQARAGLKGLEENLAAIPASAGALLARQDQLEQGRAALDAGWSDYHAGRARLREAKRELDEAAAQLEQAQEELKAGKIELMNGEYELESARIELEDALKKLQDGEKEYTDGLADYDAGVAELSDARETLAREKAEGEAELSDAARELDRADRELRDGEQEYADGLAEYEQGRAEADQSIAQAQEELDKARRDVESIQECSWYILDRNTNMGYVSYSMDADRMGRLASVFPLIFFLVAALVCLTTMTRMVEEQRVTIGGMKALGYSRGAIAVKYVGYGFLASAIGSLVGLAVGLTLLPWIICTAWSIIYATGEIYYSLEPATSIMACLAAVGIVTLSALGACFSALSAVPAQLMRPKAPPMGRRILLERIAPLWRRLSFQYKITLRNLFRYQKRFWMTVAGIGGCAALIVTAFGLRDSIFDVMDRQYDEIYRYTAQVGLVDKVTEGEREEVRHALDGSSLVEDYAFCRAESVTARTDAYSVECTLQTAWDQEELERFVTLRHRTDDRGVTLPDDGVVLTEKLARLLGVGPGDTFTLEGEETVQVRVADVTEHYIQHNIYLTEAFYHRLFGHKPEANLVLADYEPQSEEAQALTAELVALDGVTSLSLVEDTRRTFSSSMESVDYAVVLIIVCAAALAFVVLYNLTNINITERMRELATLKVLGFYDGELSAYVYRENVILTIFGVGLGMLMGKALHQWLILTVEIDLLMFGRTLRPESYGWAVALTVLFSLLVNLAAHRKLKKLDMVESLKTVE